MSKYEKQFNWIKEAWQETPATVICREIYSFNEFPKWEDCPKDHIYVGVIQNEYLNKNNPDFDEIEGDIIYFVKHQMSGMLEITFPFDKFSKSEVLDPLLGLVPHGDQICQAYE